MHVHITHTCTRTRTRTRACARAHARTRARTHPIITLFLRAHVLSSCDASDEAGLWRRTVCVAKQEYNLQELGLCAQGMQGADWYFDPVVFTMRVGGQDQLVAGTIRGRARPPPPPPPPGEKQLPDGKSCRCLRGAAFNAPFQDSSCSGCRRVLSTQSFREMLQRRHQRLLLVQLPFVLVAVPFDPAGWPEDVVPAPVAGPPTPPPVHCIPPTRRTRALESTSRTRARAPLSLSLSRSLSFSLSLSPPPPPSFIRPPS